MNVVLLFPTGPLPPIIPPFPDHWQMRTVHSTEEMTEDVLKDADALLMAVHAPLEGEVLERLRGVKLVQWVGVGLDCIDLDAARRLGIPVANVYAANAVSVAEYVILAMLYILRRVPDLQQAAREDRNPWPGLVGSGMFEARGRSMGILGYGAIGHEVAVRCRAFGMEILAASAPGRERQPDAREKSVGARRMSFDEILETSDVLSLNLPLNSATAGLIGRAELLRMKPGSYLVNAARGGIVDEAALAAVLHEGHLAGAAVDTFAEEPIPADNPLWEAPNCFITPHCGGNTVECTRYVAEESFANISRAGRGEEPRYRVC